MFRRLAFLLPVFICVPAMRLSALRGQETRPAAPDRTALEQELAKRLSNSRLTGYYMTEGQEGLPRADQYTLGRVAKADGDKWLITAAIQYGTRSIPVPLELPIYWAGDTPVISVTDFRIPGLGTYTARVMIYGDHYSGTWSSPRHGGYLWGTIRHVEPDDKDRKTSDGTNTKAR